MAMLNDTPAPMEPKPPRKDSVRFTTAEVSFFDTGQMIETGQMVLPEATSRQGRVKRWVRQSPGLAGGFACALLVVLGFWIGSGDASPPPAPAAAMVTTAPPPAVQERPAPVERAAASPVERSVEEKAAVEERAESEPAPVVKPVKRDRKDRASSSRKSDRRSASKRHSSRR
jgi:hypothetical protein